MATSNISQADAPVPILKEVTVSADHTGGSVGVGILGQRELLDIPLSATSYTAAMILDQGARSTAEVLANDPSIRVQDAGDGNYDYFSLRGFRISAAAFSLNGLYGVLPWNTLSPEAVERFEVIRGPSTTLSGASPFDNPGGAINVQPKRAGTIPLTQFTASYDAGGQSGVHADVGRRFGTDNEWGIRGNAMYRDGELARDHQSEQAELFTVGADYDSDALRLSLDAGHQYLRTDGASFLYYIYEGTEVPSAPETDDNTSPKWAYAKSRDDYAATRIEFDASEQLMLYAAAGVREHKSSIVNPYTEILDGEGGLYVYPYQEAYYANTFWSGEAGTRVSFDTGSVSHRLILSGSGIRFNAGWLGTYSDGFTALPEYESNLYDPTYPSEPDLSNKAHDGQLQLRNTLKGVSLIDTMEFDNGRYQAMLGIRRQTFDIERLYDSENPYNDSAWSPSVGLLARLDDSVVVYGNYLVGLSQGPFAPVGTENQNEPFPPSKSRQYEIGAKARWSRLFTSLALFQITQPAGLTDADTNVFSVNGKQRHRGVEWTASGKVTNRARILGGINYIDADLVRTENATFDNNRAPGVPEWTANLGGEWDLPQLAGATLTGRMIYTDSQYIFADNEQSIPSWTRIDVGARYAFKSGSLPTTLRVNAVNVTGKDYWASAQGSGLTLGEPRTLLFSVTVDL